MTQLNIEPHDEATVAIAYDTRFVVYIVSKTLFTYKYLFRQSSPLLASIVKRAAQALYTVIMDFGEKIDF